MEIRKITEESLRAFVNLQVNAYPGWLQADEESKKKMEQRIRDSWRDDPNLGIYGVFQENELLGGMRMYDFVMNIHGCRVAVGGLGSVAVDLVHKKEKVAREIVTFFLEHFRSKGVGLVCLYPFRPDFYKKMGFGYGVRCSEYRVKAESLPRGASKKNIRLLDESCREQMLECYNRYAAKQHGMIYKTPAMAGRVFEDTSNRVAGYYEEGILRGYLIFRYRKDSDKNPMNYDLQVSELVYENREGLSELLTFLHTQLDQVRRILFHTQDEYFPFLLEDPRNGSENLIPFLAHESNLQGMGLMYRVIDTDVFFRALSGHTFGGQTCHLKISLKDSFLPENEGSRIMHFADGIAVEASDSEYDLEIRMDVAEFSSLVMGTVDFKHLYRYALADISDPSAVETVQKLFKVDEKPMCTVVF